MTCEKVRVLTQKAAAMAGPLFQVLPVTLAACSLLDGFFFSGQFTCVMVFDEEVNCFSLCFHFFQTRLGLSMVTGTFNPSA